MIRDQLEQLRTELADLAFVLDRRGRCDAADVAVTISARLGEILDESELRALASIGIRCRWPR